MVPKLKLIIYDTLTELTDLMKKDKKQWHRLLAMVLDPMFKKLGYDTNPEVDLSRKKQLIDLIVVEKADIKADFTKLPKEFWAEFDDINAHNLITFKTYSESFNPAALEELWGHHCNYLKIKNLERDQVNLYAITHHSPELILKPFKGTKFIKIIKPDEVFDLHLGNVKKVRIIVTHDTNNPILALFSGKQQKVFEAYEKLNNETDLLNEISDYFENIKAYYGEELIDMYTKEDFFRDYPPSKEHFLFPWEKAYIEDEAKKRSKGQIIIAQKREQAAQKREQAAEKRAEADRKRVEAAQKRIEAEQKIAEEERQKAEKLANVLAKLGITAEEAMKM
ncbi:hypothetical protein MHK_001873 [Candidatus Magnetomorum sp. HK-1]|nr:hypothetical protein MHK_001873 [Candidatus Magnetomorum sp. HK-1]